MEYRRMGKTGLQLSVLSYGSWVTFAKQIGRSEARELIALAFDRGINFFDNAESYAGGESERIMGQAISKLGWPLHAYVISTKLFWGIHDVPNMKHTLNRKYLLQAIDGSLDRLGLDFVDLLFCHRVDPNTPIEETVGAMAELVKAGKVRFIGLSEADSATISRAHAVHPISALQTEYSLWTREVETDVLPTVRRLGIGFVAYSPLGRGFLSGTIRSRNDLEPGDWRLQNPRFSEEAIARNSRLADVVAEIAKELAVTPAQVALAWVLSRDVSLAAIPGTRRIERLEENWAAQAIALRTDHLKRLESLVDQGVVGDRY